MTVKQCERTSKRDNLLGEYVRTVKETGSVTLDAGSKLRHCETARRQKDVWQEAAEGCGLFGPDWEEVA